MKKITSALTVVFLLGFNLFVNAQCPPSMPLVAMDATSYPSGPFIPNGSTYNCNALPFYIWANEPGVLSNPINDIFTPCIKTDYNKYWTSERTLATETAFEGGTNLGCIGPGGGCAFPVGGGGVPPVSGASIWDLYWSYLDPAQQHDMVFSKAAGGWSGPPVITLQDCWNNATLPSVIATPTTWNNATASFTCTIPAGTNIGSGTFTMAPFIAGALTDFNFGYCYVNPGVMPPGVYTFTYHFSGSQCPGGTTSTFVITIANPYTATWTAPVNLCTNAACVSLPPTVSGTAGGTWSGTGVAGTTFCPGTSGAGTFPVTYSVGFSNTCKATQVNNIIVTATPTLNITGNTSICSGQSTVLTGATATNYTWMPGGSNANTVTVTPAGSTTYTLTGANGACSAVQTVALIVAPTPTLSVTGGTICSGQSIVLTNTGTASGSYTWSPTGGSAGSATVSPASNTTYTLAGANGACTGTTTATVNVNATPTLSVAGGNICSGQSIVLTNTGTAAGSYTWSPSGGSSGTATVSPGGTTTYTLTGDNGGCSGTTTAIVNVTPTPTVSIASSAGATICSGASTTLTASGATNYTWSANAGGGTVNPVVVSPTSSTTYTVTGDASGCSSPQVITVNVTPTPTVTIAASSPTLCAGQSTVLTGGGAPSFTWMPGGSTAGTITVTPGSTTTYTLTGDNAGCTASQVTTVVVNPLPVLTVNASPSSVCTGQTTTVTVGGASTYTWSANAGGTTASSFTITPATTDTYTVNATDINGCTNSNTITVAVGASATINIAQSQTLTCSGQSVVLTGSGATSYTWSPGGSTATTITVTPGGTTTYTLDGNSGGCIGSQTITVNITPTPTVTTNASTPAICSGQNTVLTGSGATNYTWMPGGSTAGTITVTPGSTTAYTLTGESGGCMNTSVVNITVTTTPTVTASASTATLCAGQSAVLTGGGATNYTWMPGGMTASTVTVNPGSSQTYTLVGANGSCFSAQTVSVNVTALPNVIAAAGSSSICNGQSTILTASGATTYTWSANAGGVNTSTVSVTPSTTTTYTVDGTTNGCPNTAQVTITVATTPTVAVTASSGTICAGQSTILTGSGATNYTWTPGGTTNPLTVSPGATTSYTVIGDNAGCLSTQQVVTVIVNPTPTVAGSPIADSAKCGVLNGGVTGITVSGGTPGYTYQWYNGSTPIVGATNDTLSGVGPGTYSVLITDANNCVATGGVTTFTVLGSSAVNAAITPVLTQGQAPLNVTFTNGSSGATVYGWNLGNGSTSTSSTTAATTYTVSGTYTVTMIASNGGCWDTTTAIVIIDLPTTILIPNIFSPNADGINDEFFIANTGLKTLQCDIFNRWGQKFFTISAPQGVWDGKTPSGAQAADGTYFYVLHAVGLDGKTYDRQGPLTLVK